MGTWKDYMITGAILLFLCAPVLCAMVKAIKSLGSDKEWGLEHVFVLLITGMPCIMSGMGVVLAIYQIVMAFVILAR